VRSCSWWATARRRWIPGSITWLLLRSTRASWNRAKPASRRPRNSGRSIHGRSSGAGFRLGAGVIPGYAPAGLRPVPQYEEAPYSLDFALFDGDRKLDIEVDGENYHRNWDGELCRRDQIRSQRLSDVGWRSCVFGSTRSAMTWKVPSGGCSVDERASPMKLRILVAFALLALCGCGGGVAPEPNTDANANPDANPNGANPQGDSAGKLIGRRRPSSAYGHRHLQRQLDQRRDSQRELERNASLRRHRFRLGTAKRHFRRLGYRGGDLQFLDRQSAVFVSVGLVTPGTLVSHGRASTRREWAT